MRFTAKLIIPIFIAAIIIVVSNFSFTDSTIRSIIQIVTLILTATIIAIVANPFNKLVSRIHKNFHPQETPGSSEFDTISKLLDNLQFTDQSLSTQVQKIQSSLANCQLQFSTVLNSLSDAIIAVDHFDKITIANSAITKITGYSPSEVIGQPLDHFLKIQDRNNVDISIAEICRNATAQINFDENMPFMQLIGRHSQKTPTQIYCSIPENSNSSIKIVFVFRDVAKQKDLASIQLDFVSMASHELRTPLTSIIGYLSVFMDENKTKFSKDQLEFLNRIMISSKQLANLIENLLNVSKVERNAFSINALPIDWNAFLNKEVEDNRLSAANKNITIDLKVPPNLPKVNADPTRIAEVMNNLISNAINYTNEGGHIEVGATVSNNEVTTYVKDSGIGIPKHSLNRLFTKFFRVKGALDESSNSKGTGLGLYLTKSIIDLHRGRIWVESQVGIGTTFYFSLHSAEVIKPKLSIPELTLSNVSMPSDHSNNIPSLVDKV